MSDPSLQDVPSPSAEDDFWEDFRIERAIDSRMGISARRDSRSRISERILNELTGITGELLPSRTEEQEKAFWNAFFAEAKVLSEEAVEAPPLTRQAAA